MRAGNFWSRLVVGSRSMFRGELLGGKGAGRGRRERGAMMAAVMETLEGRTLFSLTALGSATQVDDGLAAVQGNAKIAAAVNGNYVLAWETASGTVDVQLYNSTGETLNGETVANPGNILTTTPAGGGVGSSLTASSLNAESFDVAMDAAGDFVVVWQSTNDVFAQRFDATGNMTGSVINVSNAGTNGVSTEPSVAMDAAGDFAVTWLRDTTVNVYEQYMTPGSSNQQVGDDNKVHTYVTPSTADSNASSYTTSVVMAQRFSANGTGMGAVQVSATPAVPTKSVKLDGSTFEVTTSYSTARNPSVAMDSAGDFVVGWNTTSYAPVKELSQAATSYTTQGQIYTGQYTPPRYVNLVSKTYAGFTYALSLTGVGVSFQRFDNAEAKVGAVVTPVSKTLSPTSTINGVDLKVSMDSAGDFALVDNFSYVNLKTVTKTPPGGSPQTYYYYQADTAVDAQRFSKTGASSGAVTVKKTALPAFAMGTEPSPSSATLTDLSSAMDPSGNLLVAWDDASGATPAVMAQRYDATGKTIDAAPFTVLAGAALMPTVAFGGSSPEVVELGYQGAGTAATDVFVQPYRVVLPASKVVFTEQPTDTVGGQTISQIQVSEEDANGFVETGDETSKVTLSVGTGTAGAKLTGTVTATVVDGVATFNGLSLALGGAYTLKAVDGSLTPGVSDSFDNITPGTQLAFVQGPVSAVAGTSQDVKVAVLDAQKNPALGDTSEVTFTLLSSGGVPEAGPEVVQAVNGVATLAGLALQGTGSFEYRISDGNFTMVTSKVFVISPAAAATMTLESAPTTGTAGVKLGNFVVDLTDEFGNPATLDKSSVTLGILTGPDGGVLKETKVAVKNGVATFSGLTISKAGNYTFKLTDGLLPEVDTGTLTVTPGAAAKMTFVAGHAVPVNATAGVAIAPGIEVQVVDAFGNLVSGNGTVGLAVASGPSKFAAMGGTTPESLVNGVATFSDIALTTAGAYVLKATSGKLTLSSGKLTVLAAGAAKLVVVSSATTATAGVAIKPGVVVDVEDAFGNLELGDTSMITMAVNAGSGNTVFGTTSAAAVKGVATFNNLILHVTGIFPQYTLKATEDGLTSGVTPTITLNPGPVATLAFAENINGTPKAGENISGVLVQLLDAFGNAAQTDKSSVTLKLANTSTKLLGTVTVKANDGSAFFTAVKIDTAGNYQFTATDGKLTVNSNAFTVAPGTPAKLLLLGSPQSATVGGEFDVSFFLEDAFGNKETGSTSDVTIAINTSPGNATLGGNTTVTPVDGQVSFLGLTLDTVGNYTLKVTDTDDLGVPVVVLPLLKVTAG